MAGFVDETGQDAASAAGDLQEIFTYQRVSEAESAQMENIRVDALVLARRIADECPPNYHRSIAIQKVREAMFWANAGLSLRRKVS